MSVTNGRRVTHGGPDDRESAHFVSNSKPDGGRDHARWKLPASGSRLSLVQSCHGRSVYIWTMDFDLKRGAHSLDHVCVLFVVQLWRTTSCLVKLVEPSPRRVPPGDLLHPLSMASTTNTSSLSSLSRTPVFTRPEKISVPSSGCSNVGLSSGTDTTIGEEDDEDTIVRGSWVWRNGQMWKISELLAAEPPKPSPPKRKVGSTHLDKHS